MGPIPARVIDSGGMTGRSRGQTIPKSIRWDGPLDLSADWSKGYTD